MEQKFYCYKITNLANNKIYIGKAISVDERWRKHKVAAHRQDPNDYSYLHRAMNKYGFENFIIEIIDEYLNEEESLQAETQFIKLFNSNNRDIGYNLTEGGEGSSGFKHSLESRQKMSQTKMAINLSGDNNPFYGQHHTEESRFKMSEFQREYFKTHEHPWMGRSHTDETRQKISFSAIGREVSLETRKKISETNKGNIRFITASKLSESDVTEIKNLLLNSDITHKEIAKKFGVSRAAITLINNGKTWSHIKI